MIRPISIILGLLCTTMVQAAVPVSQRTQHMVFTREAVQEVAARAYHQKLENLSAEGQLDTDTLRLKHVRRLGSRLIAQAIRLKPVAANWPWEIHLTTDPNIQAYSMAGGKLLVGTSFIQHYHLSDAELMVAIAHEIAHVIAEHVREQVSTVAQFNPLVPARARRVADVLNDLQSDLSIYFRLEPLSRLQEMEADDIGIDLAARAGVPPSAIVSFYTKLVRVDGGKSLFDTHGSAAQRVKFADSMAQYAWPVYEASRHARILPNYNFSHPRRFVPSAIK